MPAQHAPRPGLDLGAYRELDLGCGPRKAAGFLGVDHFAYPGVDVVCDLDAPPWPLPSGHFTRVRARHVIEHVQSIPDFMREIHRVCASGALVEVETPHFSSIDSWKDPTHRWHLSAGWYEPFCDPRNYLFSQVPLFEAVSTRVTFSKSVRSFRGRAMVKLFGLGAWERHHAFRSPARNVLTVLRAVGSRQ